MIAAPLTTLTPPSADDRRNAWRDRFKAVVPAESEAHLRLLQRGMAIKRRLLAGMQNTTATRTPGAGATPADNSPRAARGSGDAAPFPPRTEEPS